MTPRHPERPAWPFRVNKADLLGSTLVRWYPLLPHDPELELCVGDAATGTAATQEFIPHPQGLDGYRDPALTTRMVDEASGHFTGCVWMRRGGPIGHFSHGRIDKGGASTGWRWGIANNSGGGNTFMIHTGGSWKSTGDNVSHAVGQWYHKAWSWDGSTARVFSDGVALGSVAAAGARAIGPAMIVEPLFVGQHHGWFLSDLMIFDVALDEAEIRRLVEPDTMWAHYSPV